MKTMKKLFALIMALAMVMALAVTVSAADITIKEGQNDGTDNTTYDAYLIFKYTKSADSKFDGTTDQNLGTGTGTGLTYTIDADSLWLPVVRASQFFTLNEIKDNDTVTGYYVSLADESMNSADGAKRIAEYLRYNIPADAVKAAAGFKAGEKQTVEDGYYLITSTLGELVIAATSDIEITEKNSYPTLTKTAEKANYGVGDNVPYTITVEIPANADTSKPIIVHDEMPAELKFNNDVKVNGEALSEAYDLVTENLDDNCTFHIVIKAGYTAGTTLKFTYSAELLSTAAADQGYVNKAFLDYSNYETTPSTPEIKTFDFNVKKIFTGSSEAYEATFALEGYNFVKDETGYVVADSTKTESDYVDIVVKNNTTVNIRGLKAGTYTLTETATQEGYNLISGSITVTIAEDGEVTFTYPDLVAAEGDTVTITNNNGTVLPSTGGIGTTIFTVVGATLMIGAAVLFITKKRTVID